MLRRKDYANAGLYGGNDAMQFWHGPQFPGDSAEKRDLHGSSARRQHHGPRPDGQHHAIWHVHLVGEPDRSRSDGRGAGGPDPDALHPEHACAVGYRSADGDSRQFPDTRQCLEVNVHLGRGDSVLDAGGDDGEGAVSQCGGPKGIHKQPSSILSITLPLLMIYISSAPCEERSSQSSQHKETKNASAEALSRAWSSRM